MKRQLYDLPQGQYWGDEYWEDAFIIPGDSGRYGVIITDALDDWYDSYDEVQKAIRDGKTSGTVFASIDHMFTAYRDDQVTWYDSLQAALDAIEADYPAEEEL